MKKLLLSLVFVATSSVISAQTNWGVDASHSNVRFSVSHLVISEAEGNFKTFDGKVTSTGNDFNDAKVEFSIDVNSINTDNEGRDKHLKGDDFFNAEKYPKMTFKSTSFKKVDGKKYILTGDLTIRDVTKSVTFDVNHMGVTKDPWGNTKAGFKATSSINRKDYKLLWSVATETGGLVVGDEVAITINLELNQAK
jgi:polyisoprenoid-binding protein YceI